MKVDYRDDLYEINDFYGIRVDKISDEWFKYRCKYQSSPHVSELPSWKNRTKELSDIEIDFLDSMCRGSHSVRNFPRRKLKVILTDLGVKPLFYSQGYKPAKIQTSLRMESFKADYMKEKLKKDFSNSVLYLFTYWIEHEGLENELFDYHEKFYRNNKLNFQK